MGRLRPREHMAAFLQPRPNPRLQMINRNRSPMPAVKRPRSQHLQGSPTSKRHTAESVNDDSTEDSKKKVNIDRIPVENAIREQIEKYQKEMAVENSNEAKLKLFVKDEQKQEDKLQAIYQKVAKYKRQRHQDGKKEAEKSEPDLYELFEKKLNDALQQATVYKRNDEEMATLPKLAKNDLDNIEWPGAAECRNLNEKIQILVENVEKTLKDFKTAQAQKANYKIRDLEYSLF
ncbi:unnamed protein product [Caenorhabditis brenneri]